MVLKHHRTIICKSGGASNCQVKCKASEHFPARTTRSKRIRLRRRTVASPSQHEFEEKDYATVQAELSEISLSGSMLPLHDDDESASVTNVLEQLFECAKNGDLCSFQRTCARAMRYLVRLDTPGYMGWTAAHWAAREGNVDLLQYLTLCHANLYALDFKGDTLLHKAAANGQLASCEWLLEHGFSVNMRNYNNLTPLDLARERIALSGRSSGAALCESILVKHS